MFSRIFPARWSQIRCSHIGIPWSCAQGTRDVADQNGVRPAAAKARPTRDATDRAQGEPDREIVVTALKNLGSSASLHVGSNMHHQSPPGIFGRSSLIPSRNRWSDAE